jgi:predicted flap endonuclease-1-like 5' DNA nuclease
VTPDPAPVPRITGPVRLDLTRLGTDSIVTVNGRPGIFTPLTGETATDAHSTTNLEKILDVLKEEIASLRTENAALDQKVAELSAPARSSDDFASGLQHTLDVLQQRLSSVDNSVSDFAVREFSLESKVHVEVTALGTIGLRFVQPGETVNAAALSTVNVTIVPMPKAPTDSPPATPKSNPAVDALDGLSSAQIEALRESHVNTVAEFRTVALRARTEAILVSLLDVDRKALGRYVSLADLLSIPGLDRVKAAVLHDAGFTDSASLAAASAKDVVRKYARVAKKRADDDGFRVDEGAASAWIDSARLLHPSQPQ